MQMSRDRSGDYFAPRRSFPRGRSSWAPIRPTPPTTIVGLGFASQSWRRQGMLDSWYGPDEANEMAYNDEPDDPGSSERGGESWPRRRPTGIDVRFLPAGTEMVVDTRNSRY